MIWLTLRQNRVAALGAALAAIALFAVVLYLQVEASAITGSGLAAARRWSELRDTFSVVRGVMFALPLLPGLFVGAPLVASELETTVNRLVWTQSITRRRWLVGKLVVVLLPALALAVVLSLLTQWTATRLDGGGLWEDDYDVVGAVFVGYVVFSLALGIAAGALLGRLLPAIAVTFFGFVVCRVVVVQLRPHFMPFVTATWRPLIGQPRIPSGSWVVNTDFSSQTLATIYYQPAERFWTFQAIEAAIFIVPSALLLAVAARWVLRHTG